MADEVTNEQIIDYVKDRLRQDVDFNCKIILYRHDVTVIVLEHKIKR